jgi:transposase
MEGKTVEPVLHMAIELDGKSWKLAFGVGLGHRPRLRQIAPCDRDALLREIESAKERYGLSGAVRVVSCYEAGRDGFWLHRFLAAKGVENVVVDASSIEVPRRWRRAKTDRLDVGKLLERLIKYTGGSREWRIVRVPSTEAEDARQLQREREAVKAERTAVSNRIKSLLTTQGVTLIVRNLPVQLESVQLWDGSALPELLKARLLREWHHWKYLSTRIHEIETLRKKQVDEASEDDEPVRKITQLNRLRSVGVETSTLLVREVFGWRQLRNRRQVGSLAGLTPTPYASGGSQREQGISKAGNPRVRHCAIELAWMWLRYQPQSQLARWYQERFADSPRQRKVGIVALARKLLIALWRYLETGTLPEGALLKA